jgi:hypothetical protein
VHIFSRRVQKCIFLRWDLKCILFYQDQNRIFFRQDWKCIFSQRDQKCIFFRVIISAYFFVGIKNAYFLNEIKTAYFLNEIKRARFFSRDQKCIFLRWDQKCIFSKRESLSCASSFESYRIRAAAGTGSACGPGASPAPDLRESARAAPRTRKYRRAARLGCNGAQWSPGVRQRQQQPRALLEDTGLQSRPTTDGSTEIPNADARVCANGLIFHLSPGPDQPPQSSNYELDRPGCDTRPLRRDMSFATSVDKVVLTRCVQHLHFAR